MSLMMALGRRVRQRQPGDMVDFSAFPILKVLSHQGPMRLSALAQTLGLDASTVSRHAASARGPRPARAHRGPRRRARQPHRGLRSTARSCLAQGLRDPPPAHHQLTRRAQRPRARHPSRPAAPAHLEHQHPGDRRVTPDSNGYLSHRQILVVMGGLMTGMFLAALDQSIVSTALPRITSELGGLDKLSWVVTAYMLAATASTPLWGKISDLYGRRLLFQIAIVTFVIGSLLSGFSQNIEQLIAFRAVQGLGGGGLIALALATIGDVIPPRERGRYQGYFAAVFGTSSVLGPVHRRLLRRRPRLAVDLLHERPDRPGRPRGDHQRAEDAARAARALDRLPRRRSRGRRRSRRSCSTPPGPARTTAGAPASASRCSVAGALLAVAVRARRAAGQGADPARCGCSATRSSRSRTCSASSSASRCSAR